MKATAVENAWHLEASYGNANAPREGKLDLRQLLSGPRGALNSYHMFLVGTGGDYTAPRHRHTFDQVRLCLSGDYTYTPGITIPPGWLAYFPEGAYYGPEEPKGESLIMAIQYGGPSANGFLPKEFFLESMKALWERGTFAKGVYTYFDDKGVKHNKDAHNAVYEHALGRSPAYPKPRFPEPVLIDPEAFTWMPEGTPDVDIKHLATFGERGHMMAMLRVRSGARHALGGGEALRLYFLKRGTLEADGSRYGEHSAFHLEAGETQVIVAVEDCEIFMTQMHRF